MSGIVQKYKNIIGNKFNRLQILAEVDGKRTAAGHINRQVKCQCECGNIIEVRLSSIIHNHTKSCGCVWDEKMKDNKPNLSHGDSKINLYSKWCGIKRRCYEVKNEKYPIYGGRGIIVCNEWLNSYVNFRAWSLLNGYKEGLEIDRRNNDGNYDPLNCRWVTRIINCNNRSSCVYVILDNEKMSVTLACRKLNLENKYKLILQRMKRNSISFHDAIKYYM